MNVSVQPSHDIMFLNRMVNHLDISPFIRDDRTTGKIDCSVLDASNSIILKIVVDECEAGFAILLKQVGACQTYELHSGLLPGFRGSGAIAAGRAVIAWAKNFGLCQKLTTWAWEHARHVLLVTRRIGFQEERREDWPNTVNGKQVRRVIFAINFSPLLPCP